METIKLMFYGTKYMPSLVKETTLVLPATCPNCGVANNPQSNFIGLYSNIAAFTHLCTRCSKYHYTMQAIRANDGEAEELFLCYPEYSVEKVPTLLLEHCPNFSRVYSQALRADSEGLEDLAGMGYRAALEFLIKDYALAFNLDTLEDIAKLKTLSTTISHYFNKKNGELLAFNTAEVVSIVGNDFTHWYKEHDFTLSDIKNYLDIMITYINAKFQMKYPIVSRQKKD